MKFKQFHSLNEDANSILKKIIGSSEYKDIIKMIQDIIEEQALNSDDYTMMKNMITQKLIIKFKETI
jgi:ribosomal protein S3AE